MNKFAKFDVEKLTEFVNAHNTGPWLAIWMKESVNFIKLSEVIFIIF